MKQYYELLDGLRAYAVLAVLVSHWVFTSAIKKLDLGYCGVTLFFVISGFLITEILLNDINKQKGSGAILRKFYWRRTLRIFPIYYISLIALYLVNYRDSAEILLYNVTYTTNIYNYISGDFTKGFPHIWSLCVEEQFYLVWPIVLLLTHRRVFSVMVIIIALSLLTRTWFWYAKPAHYDMFNYRMTPACLDVFGLGAILAYLKMNHLDKLQRFLKMWWLPLILSIIFIVNVFYVDSLLFNEVFKRFVIGVISMFLIGWAINEHNGMQLFLKYSWLKYIGRISYGVYLYHMFVSGMIDEKLHNYLLTLDWSFLPMLKFNLYLIKAPIFLAITIAVAGLSYRFIELPFLRLKDKYTAVAAA